MEMVMVDDEQSCVCEDRLQRALMTMENTGEKPNITLREKQVEALQILESGADVIVQLPTGYGKTLIFELFPFIIGQDSAVLVACPLEGILNQMEMDFNRHSRVIKVDSAFLKATHDSDCDALDLSKLKDFREGLFRFVIGHPEHITDPLFLAELRRNDTSSRIKLFVIDEAHCIIHWGKSMFRPAFLMLKRVRSLLLHCQVLACTATASPESREEIAKELMMSEPRLVITNPDRKNIKLNVKRRPAFSGGENTAEKSVEAVMDPLINRIKNSSPVKSIVYMPLQWCAFSHDSASRVLGTSDGVGQYHSPQTPKMKSKIVSELKKEDGAITLVCATDALSMGVDIADIREVHHIGCPSSPETYMQEIGRAGRDGEPAVATMWINNSDIAKNKTHLMEEMREFCTTDGCRRQLLLEYFGFKIEDHDRISTAHNCCDNCEKLCRCDDCILVEESVSACLPLERLEIDVAKKRNVLYALKFYIAHENSIKGDYCVPSSATGMDEHFTEKLVSEYLDIEGLRLEMLIDAFPSVRNHNLENCLKIMKDLRRKP